MNRKEEPKVAIKVKLNPENPEPPEVLAEAIINISEGFQRFMTAGLNRRALVVLLQDAIGAPHVSKQTINWVLDALPLLGRMYVKKP